MSHMGSYVLALAPAGGTVWGLRGAALWRRHGWCGLRFQRPRPLLTSRLDCVSKCKLSATACHAVYLLPCSLLRARSRSQPSGTVSPKQTLLYAALAMVFTVIEITMKTLWHKPPCTLLSQYLILRCEVPTSGSIKATREYMIYGKELLRIKNAYNKLKLFPSGALV